MTDPDAPISSWMPIVWYKGYLPGLPDLCLGRWPADIATETPWKLWAVESAKERDALLAALARPVPRKGGALDFSAGPDAAVSRPGTGDPVLALYEPPAPGWPWITLGRWPREIGRQVEAHREVYTWDPDMTEAAAHDRIAQGIGDGMSRAELLSRPPAGTA
ncbi:hypothetical protein VQ02_33600 [Methylobacterium variabile]|jgi:hypothetical protein|uniref:Uncharacterized protein n=1 Tax=Methylobacterium variabile TaxID=298794 RepID=A0A0J6RWI8_9HYPH|nr:hypothetical protein [Methylobacterium variabile]KMO27210.1 hypothetical protein VQ02_33600 [Methylobacterium variabile]